MDKQEAAVHPSLEKRAEAAAWLARLRSPDRTSDVDRGFNRWLKADAGHRRAFELLNERLEITERLKAHPLPAHWRPAGARAVNRRPMAIVATAATVLVMAGAAWLYPRYAGISTGIGEQRTLTLADGTRVYLNTDTRIVTRYDDSVRRIDLKHGEAMFEVAKDAGRPFTVYAGDRRVTALGTSFMVRRDADRTAVTLVEGKVSVTSTDENSAAPVMLTPAQRLVFSGSTAPRLETPPLDRVMAWRQGQIALEDMPLSQAIVEMNRYSTVKLTIEQPESLGVRVGGFFRMGDSMSFARAVASTYGLQVIERPDGIILSGQPATR